ncbi:hypothetical protein EA772_01215 [Pedobacter sp. G11]|uniref:hypothetical protein n=1 Tax=Pedobacter sp. G11 TaxID=2482728 RepID=UPI000F5E3050|nr:hypothetical protein [Pedobacter sp. G11]AZI24028.1 hypothetical protein EA772_01215 [Pedobacter sp. G11]
MNKIRIGTIFIIIIVTISLFLYWIVSNSNKDNAKRVKMVEKKFNYSKGVIAEIHSYKGHSIKVKYKINGIDYTFFGGWDNNPEGLNINDSISFKYSITDPNLIITELEKEYNIN